MLRIKKKSVISQNKCLLKALSFSNQALILSHHLLQDVLRIAYPPHQWEWIHPFQVFWHIKSSSPAGRTKNGLPTPSLRMDTPVSGISTYKAIISYRTHLKWLTHSITENRYTHFRRFDILSRHQLQDALRMASPPHYWEWIQQFRRLDILSHHHLQDALRRLDILSHQQLQLMMT